MKLIASFEKFLKDEINLNETRLDRASEATNIVKDFLKGNDLFFEYFKSVSPQGSFRQKTIIKPFDENQEFDVDLLFLMEAVKGWEPRDFLQNLHNEFKKTDRYKDIVDRRGKTRCVTLDYEGDFHIDIVPCISIDGSQKIMNKETNLFEDTDGDGFAKWFEEKNAVTNGNLVSVIKLFKYIRDKDDLEIKSVLLTTLFGMQVDNSTPYPDAPTSLQILLAKLNEFLSHHPTMPIISNPVLPSETFNRHWDQEKYISFRRYIEKISGKVDEAISSDKVSDSLEKWRLVFGEDFPLSEEDESSSAAGLKVYSLGSIDHAQPITNICQGENINGKARIDGYLYWGSIKTRGINSDAKIESDRGIKYVARTNVKPPYKIFWQVVNTGQHASTYKNGLRGEFFEAKKLNGSPSENQLVNWERSEYTGKHWIECFVIKDNWCVARSGRFLVNITNPNHKS